LNSEFCPTLLYMDCLCFVNFVLQNSVSLRILGTVIHSGYASNYVQM